MASKWYGKGLLKVADRTVDYAADTIKIMLLKSTYTYSADHDFVDDVVEFDGTGYTGGFNGASRKTLASKTITEDTTNDRIEFDAADPSAWTGLNGATIGGAAIIKEITNDAASILIAFLDPADLVTNGGDVTLTFNAEGIMQISYA